MANYGHFDFRHLNYLPNIKTKQKALDIRSQALIDSKIARTADILAKSARGGDRNSSRPVLHSTLGRIEEADEEDERPSTCHSQRDTQGREDKKKDETLSILANRFDFRINNSYRIANIKVDEKGERVKALTCLHGRVVSRDGISYNASIKLGGKNAQEAAAE